MPRASVPATGNSAERPFWSVMIPCWNPDRRFLSEALQSVLAAGAAPADMQIALVDDASPEFDAVAFIRELGCARVEIHRATARQGIAGNWNRCVELARGRWVHILHQDDRVLPDFYRVLRSGIAKEPGVGAAFTQHVFIDEGGAIVRPGHMPPRAAGILHDWLQHIFINLTVQCAAIVLRRDVLMELGGFDGRLAYCLDWDMWQRIALAHRIWYDPSPLAEQRLHRASQSSLLQAKAKWREIGTVMARVKARLEPSEAAWVMPALRQTYLRLVRVQYRQAMARRDWLGAFHEVLGCLRVVRLSDVWAVARGRYPPDFKPAYEAGRRPQSPSPGAPARRRILFIGGTSEPGGIHVHTAEVAAALAESGCEVAILNLSIDYFSQLLENSPVRVFSATPPADPASPNGFLSWRRILGPFAGWEMVLCRGKAGQTPAAALLAIRSRAARVFTIEHRPASPEQDLGVVRRLARRLGARLINRAIAVSQETRASAIAGGYLPAGKILTCLNWVDAAAFRARPEARRRMRHCLGIGENVTVIGYFGRLAPEKRIDVLIEAFASLDRPTDLRLALVGDGWKKPELERQCQSLGIAGCVMFAGWQADAAEALAALDIVVLPSLIEGFALSLLEAMAAGRLCLAHAMDSARAAIQDAETGFLGDFSTVDGLAETLQRALRLSAAERETIGAAAARSVATEFARHRRLPAVLAALEAPEAAALAARTDRGAPARHFAFSL